MHMERTYAINNNPEPEVSKLLWQMPASQISKQGYPHSHNNIILYVDFHLYHVKNFICFPQTFFTMWAITRIKIVCPRCNAQMASLKSNIYISEFL